ncbi:MAG: hypothetical protein EOO93_07360 [Pedobacter sp.]|nr:MAG: hypothetical protein EOO93_07360 [Pedobacter sp.]
MIANNSSNTQDSKKQIKQRDFFKGVLIGACILWPCIVVAAIYFYYKKGNIALFFPALTIFLSFLPVYLRFKTLDSEVKEKKLG